MLLSTREFLEAGKFEKSFVFMAGGEVSDYALGVMHNNQICKGELKGFEKSTPKSDSVLVAAFSLTESNCSSERPELTKGTSTFVIGPTDSCVQRFAALYEPNELTVAQ